MELVPRSMQRHFFSQNSANLQDCVGDLPVRPVGSDFNLRDYAFRSRRISPIYSNQHPISYVANTMLFSG